MIRLDFFLYFYRCKNIVWMYNVILVDVVNIFFLDLLH